MRLTKFSYQFRFIYYFSSFPFTFHSFISFLLSFLLSSLLSFLIPLYLLSSFALLAFLFLLFLLCSPGSFQAFVWLQTSLLGWRRLLAPERCRSRNLKCLTKSRGNVCFSPRNCLKLFWKSSPAIGFVADWTCLLQDIGFVCSRYQVYLLQLNRSMIKCK